MSLHEEIQNSNFPYSPTVVVDMIDSNYLKYGYVRAATKKVIFFMMRRVVLRGVAKFVNTNKNRSNDTTFGSDDIVSELYMVLSNCVDKFDTRLKKDFYFYFNSSVSRRVGRISDYKIVNNDEITFSRYQTYISPEGEINVEEFLEDKSYVRGNEGEVMDYINSIPWLDKEHGVLESLKQGRGVNDVMRENGINKAEYVSIMQSIRSKIKID